MLDEEMLTRLGRINKFPSILVDYKLPKPPAKLLIKLFIKLFAKLPANLYALCSAINEDYGKAPG